MVTIFIVLVKAKKEVPVKIFLMYFNRKHRQSSLLVIFCGSSFSRRLGLSGSQYKPRESTFLLLRRLGFRGNFVVRNEFYLQHQENLGQSKDIGISYVE